MSVNQTIAIFAAAPPQPPLGAPCNGCGVCCLLAPCPLGVLLSGRRHGACQALRWQGDAHRYRCGAITEPEAVLRERFPVWAQNVQAPLAVVLRRFARRWVAAGVGCDCDAQLEDDT